MATTIQYALMAGASYIDTRLLINRFPIPDGWETLMLPSKIPGELVSSHESTPSTGFEAVSFFKVTGTTTEIVISFAGTGTAIDHVANVALALGNPSSQLAQTPTIWMCW